MTQPVQTGRIFVGRQREMAGLRAAMDDAVAGRGRLVMLAGEPGIGKTRTAQELSVYAESAGAQVWWGSCHEQQGAPPYWPWVEWASLPPVTGSFSSPATAMAKSFSRSIVPPLATSTASASLNTGWSNASSGFSGKGSGMDW